MKKLILLLAILTMGVGQAQENYLEIVYYNQNNVRFAHIRSEDNGRGCYTMIQGEYDLKELSLNNNILNIQQDDGSVMSFSVVGSSFSQTFSRNVVDDFTIDSNNRVHDTHARYDFNIDCSLADIISGYDPGIIDSGWYSVAIDDLSWNIRNPNIVGDSLYISVYNNDINYEGTTRFDEFYLQTNLIRGYQNAQNIAMSGQSSITIDYYPHGVGQGDAVSIGVVLNETDAPNVYAYNTALTEWGSLNFVERHGNWFRKSTQTHPNENNYQFPNSITPEYIYVTETGYKTYTEDSCGWIEVVVSPDRSTITNSGIIEHRSNYSNGNSMNAFQFGRFNGSGSNINTPIISVRITRYDDDLTPFNEYGYNNSRYDSVSNPTLTICN